jgi:hypothetical protein
MPHGEGADEKKVIRSEEKNASGSKTEKGAESVG